MRSRYTRDSASCGSARGLKNQVHAILHRNLVPRCPAADLFGIKGRNWLAAQDLPSSGSVPVGGYAVRPVGGQLVTARNGRPGES